MRLTNAQWTKVEGLIPDQKWGPNGSGRPAKPARDVLDGILWVLRTGAPWADMPSKFPSYHTCHRLFQAWVADGVFEKILQALWDDLVERGDINNVEAFIDGSYVPAKREDHVLGFRGLVPRRRSWQSQTEMVFLSLSLLLQETDPTSLSPSERSRLRLWMNSRRA